MSAELLSQHRLGQLIGPARLRRLVRAGWIEPAQRRRGGGRFGIQLMFSSTDVRRILKRLEAGERPGPDRLESVRVLQARLRRGEVARVQAASGWDTFALDF